jgi:glycosyltransferase involved in cell wall biosynthesis
VNILLISHRVPYPLKDGGAIALYNTLKGLSFEGHQVTLFGLAARKHDIDLRKAEKTIQDYCTVHFYPINTDVTVIGALKNLFGQASYNVSRFYDSGFEKILTQHVAERTFDLIQFETTFTAQYARALQKIAPSTPLILRQHNVEAEIWQRRCDSARNPLEKWYLHLLTKRLRQFENESALWFDGMITLTETDKEYFKKAGTKVPTAAIAPGFVFPEPREIKIPKLHFFHIGSMKWEPNADAVSWFADKIWPSVNTRFAESTFHFAGLGLNREWKHSPDKQFFNSGEVDSINAFVADKDICVVPLRSGSGIRIKILECMAAGKLVMSTAIGAQGIALVPGTHYLKFEDASEFTEHVAWIKENPEQARALMENGRDFARSQFSLESVSKKTTAFFEQIIEAKEAAK